MGEYMGDHTNLRFSLENQQWMNIRTVTPHMFHMHLQPSNPASAERPVERGQRQSTEKKFVFTAEHSRNLLNLYTEQAMLQVDKTDGAFQLFASNRQLLLDASISLINDDSIESYEIELPLQSQDIICETANGIRLMSNRGWGMLLIAGGCSLRIEVTKRKTAYIAMQSDSVHLYLFSGHSYKALLQTLTDIAGKPELLPLRAYGLSYVCPPDKDAQEVIQDAIKFREADIPCDYVILRDDFIGDSAEGKVRIAHHSGQRPMSFVDTLRRHEFQIIRGSEGKQLDPIQDSAELRPFSLVEMDQKPKVKANADALFLKQRDAGQSMMNVLHHGLSGQINTAIQMDLSSRESIHASFLQAWTYVVDWHPSFLDATMQRVFRNYAKLRYQLLPYIYSTAHIANQTGMPMTRSMQLMFPEDPQCYSLQQQYMLGDFLLVAVFTDRVYLPEGEWIDYWTGENYVGAQWLDYRTPEKAGGPLFVRAGAILPSWPNMKYIGSEVPNAVTFHVYPQRAHSAHFELFEDDGVSEQYKSGHIASTEIQYNMSEDGKMNFRISRRKGSYKGMNHVRNYCIILHNMERPNSIDLNGQQIIEHSPRSWTQKLTGWNYNHSSRTVQLYVYEVETDKELLIEFINSEANGFQSNDGPRMHPKLELNQTDRDRLSRQHLAALYTALEHGNADEVEKAVEAWWENHVNLNTNFAVKWRMNLIEGAMICLRYVEKHGGEEGRQMFLSELDQLFMLRDIHTPVQGYNLLQRWFRKCVQFGHKPIQPPMHPLIRRAIILIEHNPDLTITLQETARLLEVSGAYLSRLFSKETGVSFTDYALKVRMERAKELLANGLKVHETAAITGFKDAAHFSRTFKKFWGMTPANYKRDLGS